MKKLMILGAIMLMSIACQAQIYLSFKVSRVIHDNTEYAMQKNMYVSFYKHNGKEYMAVNSESPTIDNVGKIVYDGESNNDSMRFRWFFEGSVFKCTFFSAINDNNVTAYSVLVFFSDGSTMQYIGTENVTSEMSLKN